jgi:hypothetical protein
MAYEDLLKDTSEVKDNGDYFLVTITDLEPAEVYPIQFRWKYKDKTLSEWSAVKKLTTPGEGDVPVPNVTIGTFTAGTGRIIIYWDGKDSNNNNIEGVIDRVNVYISGSNNVFGEGPAGFLKEKGTLSISAPAGTYDITLRSVTARGQLSDSTEPVEIIIAETTPIESPTLPKGLSAASAPFALTVSWTGEYASQTFSGFKSLNIYASASDLGSSTATDLSNKLVGSMTVDQTSNKITVGLDVLKQVLSLTSQQAYDASIYLYYLAVNANGVPYKVSGVTTYTRINSSAIAPTKANLIDLANGLISIENLVAGNGQFQGWLRTGIAGQARIELSSSNVNPSQAGGYDVLSGFTVYKSDNTPAFRADLAGNVSIGGYTATDIASISSTATSASSTATSAQQAAATANSNALSAQQAATAALLKTQRFNEDGSALDLAIAMNPSGSIYSNKSTYDNTNNGWFLGNNITGTAPNQVVTPVLNIGSSSNFIKWNGSSLEVQGVINATGGSFGSSTTKWEIGSSGITATGNALIDMGTTGALELGDFSLSASGTQLVLTESGTTRKILETDNAGSNGRIFLGYEDGVTSRQVQVRKSAQVAGEPATNSGGLRNMYTISEGNFAEASIASYYQSAENGAVLLVWDQNSNV